MKYGDQDYTFADLRNPNHPAVRAALAFWCAICAAPPDNHCRATNGEPLSRAIVHQYRIPATPTERKPRARQQRN